jgi:hypothetical protein
MYACGVRSLAEAQDRQAVLLLRHALQSDGAEEAATLGAACYSRDGDLMPLLAKIAASRPSHLAFGAELARVARGESNGQLLAELAPKIKESHRIAMCTELFVPLSRSLRFATCVGPALGLLRSAERHLGRWLLLGEVAVQAGDMSPLDDAQARLRSGMASSRAAWALAVWALEDADAAIRGRTRPCVPPVRLTVELVARLSDRPSSQRDMTFLFRLAAHAQSPGASMLDSMVRTDRLESDTTIRAALILARDHGREDVLRKLVTFAESDSREEIRGLAAAAMWDAAAAGGSEADEIRGRSCTIANRLVKSRFVANRAWAALIRAAYRNCAAMPRVVDEASFRWVQSGRVE